MNQQNQFSDIEILEDKYVLCFRRMLGQGSFASVYGGYILQNENEKIAIKIIKNKQGSRNQQQFNQKMNYIKRECENQMKLQSDNIVKMIAAIQIQDDYYFILEYCEEKSLQHKIKYTDLSEQEILLILKQIVNGYKELIKNQIVHRDLKPENILFSKGIAKIGDFGFSKLLDDLNENITHSRLGSPLYAAPEILTGKYTAQADIWSLGIILYEMIYGQTPFIVSKYENCDLQKQKESPIIYPEQNKVNQELINLLKKMLVLDPKKRINWSELFVENLTQMIVNRQSKTLGINYTFGNDIKVQSIFNYFIYISDILQFIRCLMRDVFSLHQIVQFSDSQYFHYTIITVKYMLNEIKFYLRILKGENLFSILILPNDFQQFMKSKKFDQVLNNFKSNETNLEQFYTQIIGKYDNYLQQFQKSEEEELKLEFYREGFLQNENNSKLFKVFNDIYVNLINHIISKFNHNLVQVQMKDNMFRILIKLLNCLQPLVFSHRKLYSYQLEQELYKSLNLEQEFNELYAKIFVSEQ